MRPLVFVLVVAGLGCTAETSSSGGDAGRDAGPGFDALGLLDGGAAGSRCVGSDLSVHTAFPLPEGRQIRRATIVSAKVDHTASVSTLTATLEGSGTLRLRWKGDARAELVKPYGLIAWGDAQSWCINGDSEMRFTSDTEVVFERFIVGDDPGLVADDSFTQCHFPSDGGVPPPLPAVVQYEACIALPP